MYNMEIKVNRPMIVQYLNKLIFPQRSQPICEENTSERLNACSYPYMGCCNAV